MGGGPDEEEVDEERVLPPVTRNCERSTFIAVSVSLGNNANKSSSEIPVIKDELVVEDDSFESIITMPFLPSPASLRSLLALDDADCGGDIIVVSRNPTPS